jgi:hypothetical protein
MLGSCAAVRGVASRQLNVERDVSQAGLKVAAVKDGQLRHLVL